MSVLFHKIHTVIVDCVNIENGDVHLSSVFSTNDEFRVTTIVASGLGGVRDSLGQTFLDVVKLATVTHERLVLVCKDSSAFSADYNFTDLRRSIDLTEKLGADVLVGGMQWFDYSVKVNENLFWSNAFLDWQFIVVFKQVYEKLANCSYEEDLSVDQLISRLSKRIFLTVPLPSVNHETTEAVPNNNVEAVGKLTKSIKDQLLAFRNVDRLVNLLNNKDFKNINYTNCQVTTYIINFPERIDRLTHILSQFEEKSEFALEIFKACRNRNGAVGLWSSIKEIIQHALNADKEVMV